MAGGIDLRTRLTELLGIRYPIIQGGLAHLAFAELAAAVSNAGGLGQITAATCGGPEDLRDQIRRCRAQTDRPFAVNFAIGHRPLDNLVAIARAEGVEIISVTGGNPEPLFRSFPDHVRKLALVASVRQARKAEAIGAAAVIAVGAEGGGHLGRDDTATMVLTPLVADAVRIPVVAAGGIADARGLAAALALGAAGVEMGTRFVATAECVAHPAYKRAILTARETDTVVIERSQGKPGRALRGPHAEAILKAEAAGTPFAELFPLISGAANRRGALHGDQEHGFVWAGQAIGLMDDIPSVRDLVTRMVTGARQILQRCADLADLADAPIPGGNPAN